LDRAPQPILARAVGVSWSSKFGGGKKVMVRVRGVWWWWVPQPEKLHTFSAVKLRMWSWNCWCSRKKACLAGHPVLFLYLRLVAELLAQVFFGGMVFCFLFEWIDGTKPVGNIFRHLIG